jgi:signal transduction histidine kinase
VTPLADGSILIVGDEHRRADTALPGILSAFAWAVGATIALGVAGGLWLSAQFLRRVDAMRLAAHGIMAGDWGRRIPLSSVNDDLSALARTFKRLFDRIEKLLLANKHVGADIAHDLRKPLARILRRLEEARLRNGAADATRSALDASIAEIGGVLETFDALLRIGQIEACARRAAFKRIDLAEIARDVVEAFQPAADEGDRTLVLRLDKPLPMQGDRELLTLANLLLAGGVCLTVADNGPGADPRDLPAIFQRFYRGDAARNSPGSGLGLSLVPAIAELHGLECSASDNHPGLKLTLTTADQDE